MTVIKNVTKFNKSVTSKDVAKLAGVSQSSVSRVFNPNSERSVKPEIREKILKAANELGYKPNFIARSMISKRTGIVGLVVGGPIGPFYNKVILNIVVQLQIKGYQCLIFSLDSEHHIDEILEKVLQYQVDGLIITSAALSNDIIKLCIENKTPLILFNRVIKNLDISSVYCDHNEAGRMVGEFFANLGFKNIVNITYKKNTTMTAERKTGFYNALYERGINNILEISSDYTYDSGYKAAVELLKKKRPEAVFCSSDLIAMGFMDAARYEFGLNIPEDISIVGFDDIEMASWHSYNLTTVSQPVQTLAHSTVEVLIRLIEEGLDKPIYKKINTNLIIRGTTKKL
ncbi:transcriptional regulator, LacI family [Caloramator quimbayensis]|uniref:Transcriptional regulator, LacI family n=1 Tax=Caloramator quimbayensis TaxID=1147123 RepID=A0A1T4XTL8_9CLOT|nr:LacI family DNA-binding transcriptional regulator [Caloramator quimbayensis]SKA92864.1 transcriptional regulator, LacI family [Caloramator quimbayensis]